jgi:polygalacturonase
MSDDDEEEEHINPGNPGKFVLQRDCRERHNKITLALFGADGRGGMVADISTIKNTLDNALKRKWTAKDYASLILAIAALITAFAAVWK